MGERINYSIVESDPNTQKNPGVLKRLAVSQISEKTHLS